MFLNKLKLTLVLVLTIAVAGLGGGLLLTRADGQEKQDTKAPDDAEAIRGTWKVISGSKGGKELPDVDELKRNPWIFTADKVTIKRLFGEQECPYKLDPAKKPKTFDLTGEKGKVFKGIYVLSKDTLKICITGPEEERPADFQAKGAFQFELRREK